MASDVIVVSSSGEARLPAAGGAETTLTMKDALSGAFQALLRGDTDERDRLCAMAERAFAENDNRSLPGDYDVLKRRRPQQ